MERAPPLENPMTCPGDGNSTFSGRRGYGSRDEVGLGQVNGVTRREQQYKCIRSCVGVMRVSAWGLIIDRLDSEWMAMQGGIIAGEGGAA